MGKQPTEKKKRKVIEGVLARVYKDVRLNDREYTAIARLHMLARTSDKLRKSDACRIEGILRDVIPLNMAHAKMGCEAVQRLDQTRVVLQHLHAILLDERPLDDFLGQMEEFLMSTDLIASVRAILYAAFEEIRIVVEDDTCPT